MSLYCATGSVEADLFPQLKDLLSESLAKLGQPNRVLAPNPNGPAAGDVFLEGELGTISIPATGDVYLNRVLAWKNDVTTGYRGDSVRATQGHFISCLKDGTPFETGGRRYLYTYAAVEAAYRSLAERRSVSLAEIIQP